MLQKTGIEKKGFYTILRNNKKFSHSKGKPKQEKGNKSSHPLVKTKQ